MSTARLNLFWIVVFGLTLPLGMVVSTHLARSSFEKVKLRDQVITVKGHTEKRITSDRATWSVSITTRGKELVPANTELAAARAKVLAFLAKAGYSGPGVALSPVGIQTLHEKTEKGVETNKIEGFVLSQGFTIASTDVNSVAGAARGVSDLIAEGIELDAGAPRYQYTKLDDLKLAMLAEAAKNARDRAEKLVSQSTSKIGPLRSASQGVFQITPAFSTDVSDSGYSDTSSLEKTARAVVTLEFALVD